MTRPVLLVTLAATLLPPVVLAAQAPTDSGAFADVVAAERAFAAAARERGIRAAFLQYLAEGSTVFAPLPVDARELYAARPESPALLAWRPAVAEVSSAGDLGWTTGPWSFHPEGVGSEPVAHGHFVSVWRRHPDGTWLVEVDGGIGHTPVPSSDTTTVERAGPTQENRAVPASAGDAGAALASADDELSTRLAAGTAAVEAAAVAAGDVRVYRETRPPALGPEAWRSVVASDPRPSSAERAGLGVARSGDLGYTFGTLAAGNAGERASYYRIWRRTPEGWRLVLDLMLPPPSPPSADG